MGNVSKFTFQLDGEQEQALLGTLFGDGGMESTGVNSRFTTNCRLLDRDYIWWKHELLSPTGMFKRPPFKKLHHKYGKEFWVWQLISRASPTLLPYSKQFYLDGTKRITREVLERLFSLGLAVWYMDDGCLSIWGDGPGYMHKKLRLSTQGFPYEDHLLMRDWFISRYDIKFKIYQTHHRRTFYLCLDKLHEVERFLGIVSPYIVSCMLRKLGI